MDNFEWRPRARCVAFAEQLLFAIAFPVSIVITLVDVDNASKGVEPTTERDKIIEEVVIEVFGGRDGMLLFLLLKEELFVLIVILGLWATLRLLRATALKRRELKEVLRLCKLWRNVNLFFLLLGIIDLFLFSTYISLIVELIVVGLLLVFLYVVTAFMQEVNTVVNHIPVISGGSDTI